MEEAARASGRSPVALLEREEERERLRNAVTAAAGGRGSLVAIEGPPGIGKTCLLELASELAGDEFERLSARATELEREFPWGVSAQLFERRIVTADSEEREHLLAGAASLAESAIDPTSGGGSFQAEAHGLYWLAANLSAERPLLLLVDDLQWADSASARWLRYLTPRLDGLRALVLVSVRPGAGGEAALVLAEAADVLRPAPLGLEAAGVLLADRLGRPPDPTFASACHEATGGNPFLLEELVATVAADGIEPTAAHAAGVRRLGPPAIARAVLARLGQLPPAASALARSLTILGPAGVALAAALAGLDPDDAFQAANLLVAERILRSDDELDFAHPILSSAVAEDVSPGERAAAHARAARLLAERGEDSERVALHLAATEPAGDAWTVELLCEAAAGALRRGAPDVALSHLRRALAEPPPPEQRPAVLAGLGRAAALAGAPDAVELLTRAHDAAETGPERAALAIELARASALLDGDLDRAAAVLAHEQARADDPDLAIRLAAEWTTLTRYDPRYARQAIDRVERLGREAEGGGPLTRIVYAQMAIESAFAGDSADRSAELAGRALADGTLVAEQSADSPSCYLAIHALVASGRIADAEWHLQVALSDARRRGSALGYASASMCRSHALYARGRVSDAVADGRAALDLALENGWWPMAPWIAGFLVEALVEHDDLDEAEAVLGLPQLAPWLGPAAGLDPLLESRARLRAERADHRAALTDFRRVGELRLSMEADNPAISAWRSGAAQALAALGEAEEAAELAAEELLRARAYGAEGAIGVALRALGLITGGSEGVELLQEAVATLERADARLEHARALVDLGASLRRAGRRVDARAPLREGLDQARRCGGLALARRAHDELTASGAKPRRMLVGGVAALTPSERRVAELAVEGMTNAQIAQALFVTQKTVETHLGRTYRKLDIAGREALATALADD